MDINVTADRVLHIDEATGVRTEVRDGKMVDVYPDGRVVPAVFGYDLVSFGEVKFEPLPPAVNEWIQAHIRPQ